MLIAVKHPPLQNQCYVKKDLNDSTELQEIRSRAKQAHDRKNRCCESHGVVLKKSRFEPKEVNKDQSLGSVG